MLDLVLVDSQEEEAVAIGRKKVHCLEDLDDLFGTASIEVVNDNDEAATSEGIADFPKRVPEVMPETQLVVENEEAVPISQMSGSNLQDLCRMLANGFQSGIRQQCGWNGWESTTEGRFRVISRFRRTRIASRGGLPDFPRIVARNRIERVCFMRNFNRRR